MARPEKLSLSAVVAALGPVAQSPSALCAQLNCSRATLYRKLAKLQENGLVQPCGSGRGASWRLPSPIEEFERHRAKKLAGRRIRLQLTPWAGGWLRNVLELYTRLCLGQLEQIDHDLRMRCFGADASFTSDAVQLDRFQSLVSSIKATLLDFPPGASHGVHSPHVPPRAQRCWAIVCALRHRMAWDRHPGGRIGVDFDEPLSGPADAARLVVYSTGSDSASLHIECDALLLQDMVEAFRVTKRIADGEYGVLVQLVQDGVLRARSGNVPTQDALEHGSILANELKKLFESGCLPESNGWAKHQAMRREVDALASALAACALDGSAGQAERHGVIELVAREVDVGEAFDQPQVRSLPDGFFVRYDNSQGYRVLGPCEDAEHLRIYAQSHSLQTAVQMAHNALNKQPARSNTF